VCTPQTIDVVPDPTFPYGQPVPAPTLRGPHLDFAVYVPKTRLIDFYAAQIMPAVAVSDSGGGVIKWLMDGHVGLRKLTIDVQTAQGISGIISIQAGVDFLAYAKAWVEGPCGTQIAVGSATVQGDGTFGADIAIVIDLVSGYIEADLTVTQSVINPHWDIHTPFGWPLDAVADEVLNNISRDQVRKLAGTAMHLGRWSILALPASYLNYLAAIRQAPGPHSEGLLGVCALVGSKRIERPR
jgi:hypothetical protein